MEETRVSFFSRSLTQPFNERLAFFGLTERVRFLFSSNLWLFRCAIPKVWMIRFFAQLRTFPRLRYFRVTFYRLPDISKIHDCYYSCKYFQSFVLTMYQHKLSTIVNNLYDIIWLIFSVIGIFYPLPDINPYYLDALFVFFITIKTVFFIHFCLS